MRNLKIDIEYDGTKYSGWQYQPDQRTIQGEIEAALKRMLRKPVRITGAGRTDQGVHALGQVANFLTDSRLSKERIRNGLNALVPDDIHVRKISEVDSDFHSRFSARSKIYKYQILSKPSPIRRRYFWYVKYRLDLERMAKTVKFLQARRDFRWLSVQHRGERKNTVCDVMDINLTKRGSEVIIKIEADRFLRQMVRGIVGFMVDVGRGRFAPGDAEQVLKGKIRDLYFAPPQGLFLVDVKY
jgi:tRNA pseudouridine38-40 synthase